MLAPSDPTKFSAAAQVPLHICFSRQTTTHGTAGTSEGQAMNRRQLIRGAAGVCFTGVATATRAQSTKIVLGQSAPFSGPASALGEQFKKGALLHFDRVNAHGGVGGRHIELQSLDDGYEPDRCAANTKKHIEHGVAALFGYIGTPTSLAALPIATSAKLPFIAPFTGAQ